jgi:hypothetical protein
MWDDQSMADLSSVESFLGFVVGMSESVFRFLGAELGAGAGFWARIGKEVGTVDNEGV